MESYQHVENMPSHRLTFGECGNISFENFLKRYSIRASSKSSRRSHPYLRPIENVCTETSTIHDQWKRALPFFADHSNQVKKIELFECEIEVERLGSAAEHLSPRISPISPVLIRVENEPTCSFQRFKSESKSSSSHYNLEVEKKPFDGFYNADIRSRNSGKSPSSFTNVNSFLSCEIPVLDSISSTDRTIIGSQNKSYELCRNPNCDVCQDYNKIQFHLESLIASGRAGSGEALNLLQRHCFSLENEELEFECELCGCSFDCCIELISHLSLHPENWPYVCQLCRKRFKTSLEEQRHSCGEVDKIVKSFVKF